MSLVPTKRRSTTLAAAEDPHGRLDSLEFADDRLN